MGQVGYPVSYTHLDVYKRQIPASAGETFTTGVDGQTNVLIHVVQGERELAKDCRSLARFDLKGIEPMSAGFARIEVRFLIDANGILNVTARDARTGKEQSMEDVYKRQCLRCLIATCATWGRGFRNFL